MLTKMSVLPYYIFIEDARLLLPNKMNKEIEMKYPFDLHRYVIGKPKEIGAQTIAQSRSAHFMPLKSKLIRTIFISLEPYRPNQNNKEREREKRKYISGAIKTFKNRR